MNKEQHPWYVYIVRCGDNSLYTGIAKNLHRRIKEHQEQKSKCAKYLRGRTPINLVYRECINTRSEASKREWAIKQLSKKEKERLILETSTTTKHCLILSANKDTLTTKSL